MILKRKCRDLNKTHVFHYEIRLRPYYPAKNRNSKNTWVSFRLAQLSLLVSQRIEEGQRRKALNGEGGTWSGLVCVRKAWVRTEEWGRLGFVAGNLWKGEGGGLWDVRCLLYFWLSAKNRSCSLQSSAKLELILVVHSIRKQNHQYVLPCLHSCKNGVSFQRTK